METTRNTSSGNNGGRRWHKGKRTTTVTSGIVLFILILFTICGGQKSFSQGVGISEVSITPNSTSILELRSTLRGFLAPRMTQAQRDAITAPVPGLLIYNTDSFSFNFYNGILWVAIQNTGTGVSSISGTANRISIGGTPTVPVINIDAAYIGQNSITTLGTITTGTWNGTRVGLAYGGTNTDLSGSAAIGDILYANTATSFARLAGVAVGSALISGGTGAAPSWGKIGLTSHVTGILPVANGGTGSSSHYYWTLTGNGGTNQATNFIGTTDNVDLVFRANSVERARIVSASGDLKIGDATSGTVRSTTELVMRQDGDVYGPSILRLRNRGGENGAIFETTDPTTTLVDYIFRTANGQRNFRYEARAGMAKTGSPSFHIGGVSPDAPTLSIGDNYAAFNRAVRIGTYPVGTVPIPLPAALLHLSAGTAAASTAPLKFTAGANLSNEEPGAVEYDGTSFYVTDGSGTRYALAKTLTASASLDFSSTNAQQSRDLNINLPGAAVGDPVVLGIPNGAIVANSTFTAWVSSTDNVTVRFNNYSSGSLNPNSGTFRVTIIIY
jgi:hypothetical protein